MKREGDMKAWKDRKTRLSDDKPSSSEIKLGSFRLSIHHYVGCGETWFTSCYGVFDKSQLRAVSMDDAKSEALSYFKAELNQAIADIAF
jgi:hypothetical protein